MAIGIDSSKFLTAETMRNSTEVAHVFPRMEIEYDKGLRGHVVRTKGGLVRDGLGVVSSSEFRKNPIKYTSYPTYQEKIVDYFKQPLLPEEHGQSHNFINAANREADFSQSVATDLADYLFKPDAETEVEFFKGLSKNPTFTEFED